MATGSTYPIRVEAQLDRPLSRWLWLVKWFLAIPHYIALFLLWAAFAVLSVIAFFAILFTGRYPRSLFEFNVGVLRWSWRVAYYAYGALGTDRYPPFTLAEVPDYPAHLEIAYPERLSRGLVVVKWWLLAIPHYLVVGVLLGGTWVAASNDNWSWSGPGLIGLLVVIAGVALAVTGTYPRGLFDLILGLNRWVLRVAAYAGLMTDRYPPFRLDMGGSEPGGTLTVPSGTSFGGPTAPGARVGGWGAGSILAAVAGALLTLTAVGLLVGGGVALWTDRTQRDEAGFLSTPAQELDTTTYAMVAEGIEVQAEGADWVYPSAIIGKARVRVTPVDNSPVFVGIAPSRAAARYLQGVGYASADDLAGGALVARPGAAPPTAPAKQSLWAASRVGTGTQTLQWSVRNGSWTVVVMNADGSKGVHVRADVGAKVPVLPWIGTVVLVAGAVALLAGVALLGGAFYRASRKTDTTPPAPDEIPPLHP